MRKLVIHIEGYHHPHIHINELGGEEEVSFQVGGVNYIENNIWVVFYNGAAHILFLRAVG